MNCDIKVSIITVTYNSEKTLSRTIESVLAQTYPNIEYIIMDGASKDRTIEVAESFRAQFEQKKIPYVIVSEKDNGMYDALNKAIRLCKGDIIGSVNSDDYYEKCAAEVVVEEYLKEQYDMLYADLRIIKPSGEHIKKAKLTKFASTRHWNHPTTFITKQVYEKEQYSCSNMYDDCELMLRIRQKGYKIHIVNKVLSNFVFGGMSTEKNWAKMCERIKIRCEIYRKNGYGILYYIDSTIVEFVKYILG